MPPLFVVRAPGCPVWGEFKLPCPVALPGVAVWPERGVGEGSADCPGNAGLLFSAGFGITVGRLAPRRDPAAPPVLPVARRAAALPAAGPLMAPPVAEPPETEPALPEPPLPPPDPPLDWANAGTIVNASAQASAKGRAELNRSDFVMSVKRGFALAVPALLRLVFQG